MGGGYERRRRAWTGGECGRVGECRGWGGIQYRFGGRFLGVRGGRGGEMGAYFPVWRLVSNNGGRSLEWLTYLAAAAEGKGEEMAARGYGNAVGKLGVTEYLCVDL